MRTLYTLILVAILSTTATAAGKAVSYQVDEKSYEGYFITPGAGAPLVLMVHDWYGLTDYEIKRSHMLA